MRHKTTGLAMNWLKANWVRDVARRSERHAYQIVAISALAIGASLCAIAKGNEPPAAAPQATANASADEQGASGEDPLAGTWQGTLDAGVKLRIVFQIQRSADGKLSATLDSPDQGAKGIRVDEVDLSGDVLKMTLKSLGGGFEGKLSTGEIVGKWSQGGLSFPLVLKSTEKPVEIKRPQMPQPPFPYDQREVTYNNEKAGITLSGTLTLPRMPRPCAAVLLITGSGAQDRDETLLGHKPFLVLADYLTRRGVAVLRVDDRGVGGSSGNLAQSTTDDLAADVLAGVEFLKTCPEIDPQRIGLLGHSEGGLIAPLAATRSSQVAFIVLLAGPGVTGEEILYAQGALILRASGAKPEAIARQRGLQERLFAVVKEFARESAPPADASKPTDSKSSADVSATRKRLVEMMSGIEIFLPEEQRQAAQSRAAAQAEMLLTPWFRYFLTYDPYPTLAKLKCPVLALIGEHDLQVPPDQNLPVIEKALISADNMDHSVRELPGLNHLFQTSSSGSPAEYGEIEETIAPAALEVIGDWISRHADK